MSVRIGSARIDERGKATGGKAGDQTGQEVMFQNWYAHSKGWVVIRAKDAAVREKIAKDMEYACNNNKIGYDQNERGTLYTVASKVGFDCSKVTTACETDCSALVRVCVAYAGITVANFNTSSEATRLVATGKFEKLTNAKYTESSDYLLRGDILVTRTKGHTVVVLNDGAKIAPPATPEPAKTKIDPSPYNKKASYNRLYTVTASLNLRAGVGTRKAVVAVMSKGARFRCYGYWNKNTDGRVWLLGVVTIGGKEYTGWASTKYLK